jgi:hypothetical protein
MALRNLYCKCSFSSLNNDIILLIHNNTKVQKVFFPFFFSEEVKEMLMEKKVEGMRYIPSVADP